MGLHKHVYPGFVSEYVKRYDRLNLFIYVINRESSLLKYLSLTICTFLIFTVTLEPLGP